jgi:hypothetical protein
MACSTNKERRYAYCLLEESQKERNHYEDQDVGEWIILGWIFGRQDGVVWTGLIWLRIGTSEGPL